MFFRPTNAYPWQTGASTERGTNGKSDKKREQTEIVLLGAVGAPRATRDWVKWEQSAEVGQAYLLVGMIPQSQSIKWSKFLAKPSRSKPG
jgi:hypothetical protein